MATNNRKKSNVEIPKEGDELMELDAALVAADDEEVETVAKPEGHSVSRRGNETEVEEEAQPAMTSATRRSFHERQQQEEELAAARNLRQDEAVLVGGYISAMRRKTTMEGRIAGVVEKDGHVFWTIYDGPVTVYIPFKEALPSMIMDDLLGEDGVLRQKQMMAKSIGATIPFSVEEMVPSGDDFLVYGSRKNAMQRVSNRYFGSRAANPVRVGDTLVGQFLAVGPNAAWVNVNGVDVRLTKKQISHRYMERLTSYYRAGDTIRLRVQKLELEDGKLNMLLSARPCELEDCKARQYRINRGDRYEATITSHRVIEGLNPRTQKKEPHYVASMWLEEVNMPAYVTLASHRDQEIAHSGEKVMVEVEQLADSGYVRCRILYFLSR